MRTLWTALAILPAMAFSTGAQAINVVASVKPIHGLVSAVMDGVDTPKLLLEGAASPHAYSMRPSDASTLQDADLIFWIGDELEVFLVKPIESLGLSDKSIPLESAPGLKILPVREDAAFEAHGHDEEEHEDAHEDHEKEEDAHENYEHEDHDNEEHAHGDPHLWLDPENAKAMVRAIAVELGKADPENADKYSANAAKTEKALDTLIEQTSAQLQPVQDKPFIVFHDAYQYFEKRFSVPAAGAITLTPEAIPGAKRIAEVREKIKNLGAICVFAEPQFTPRQVDILIADTGVKRGTLDPLGAGIDKGPNHYFQLIKGLAGELTNCLAD